jgi:hypothetical protein
MSHLKNIAALVLILLLAAAAPARAAGAVSADDVARFLAGMAPSEASPLTPLTKDPAWQRHARFFDNAFAQLEQRQLSKVRDWTTANLTAPRPTMFYMFSGPDFLYADAFYPKATTYVLSALEPVGEVPDLARLPDLGESLDDVEHSLSSILSFSFFKTHDMKTDLRAGEVSGTLPILSVFLVRSGKTIRDVSTLSLDTQGAMHLAGDDAGKNATPGVKITFAGSDGVERTLYYFSTDLSNSGVRASGFLAFCATLAPGGSLIKSASYLLHAGNFAVVRKFLLDNSATIIQDDSGIALAYYDPAKWQFYPFGHYAGPINKFPSMYQPAYVELFKHGQPINFGIGYRWHAYESNLLLSVRLPSDGSGAAEIASSADVPMQPAPPPRPRRPSPPPQPRGLFDFFNWR